MITALWVSSCVYSITTVSPIRKAVSKCVVNTAEPRRGFTTRLRLKSYFFVSSGVLLVHDVVHNTRNARMKASHIMGRRAGGKLNFFICV